MAKSIIKPTSKTWYLASSSDRSIIHCGFVDENQVVTTGQPILEEFATEELLRTRVDSLKGDGYYQDNFYEEEL